MANARRPNATYIPLTGVGVSRRGKRQFKGLRWLQDTNMLIFQTPNSGARYFASQWNIGLKLFAIF